MEYNFLRAWRQFDAEEVKKHLLILGLSSGLCENCAQMVNDPQAKVCPNCSAEFKYLCFRPELAKDGSFFNKLGLKLKDYICLDYEDYKKISARNKVKDIFKKETK